MDSFSYLLQAIEIQDETGVRKFINTMLPRVELYLKTVVGGSPDICKEVASSALLTFVSKVETDSISIKQNWKSYLLKIARNLYLELYKKESRYEQLPENFDDLYISPLEQTDRLVDKERISILKKCLQKLDSISRNIILFLMRLPEAKLSDATHRFNMSYERLIKQKNRTVKKLHKCYEKANRISYE